MSIRSLLPILLGLTFVLGCTGPAVAPDDAAVDAETSAPLAVILDSRDPRVLSAVVAAEGHVFVVLDHQTDERWATGDATALVDRAGSLAATRAVDLGRLPEDVLALASATWRVTGTDGTCTATLAEPVLLRRAAGWTYEDELESDPPEHTIPELSPFWDDAQELLVAEIASSDVACSAGGVASVVGNSPRVLAPSGEVDEARVTEVRALFEALPEHQAIADEYEAFVDPEETPALPESWREYDGGGDTLRVVQLRAEDGSERLVVSATAGYGCGGFIASLFAVYDVTPEGLVLRDVERDEPAPFAMIDLPGGMAAYSQGERIRYLGGEVELADEEAWMQGDATLLDLSTPFFGCPC